MRAASCSWHLGCAAPIRVRGLHGITGGVQPVPKIGAGVGECACKSSGGGKQLLPGRSPESVPVLDGILAAISAAAAPCSAKRTVRAWFYGCIMVCMGHAMACVNLDHSLWLEMLQMRAGITWLRAVCGGCWRPNAIPAHSNGTVGVSCMW